MIVFADKKTDTGLTAGYLLACEQALGLGRGCWIPESESLLAGYVSTSFLKNRARSRDFIVCPSSKDFSTTKRKIAGHL